jgi:hypothetical protein
MHIDITADAATGVLITGDKQELRSPIVRCSDDAVRCPELELRGQYGRPAGPLLQQSALWQGRRAVPKVLGRLRSGISLPFSCFSTINSQLFIVAISSFF